VFYMRYNYFKYIIMSFKLTNILITFQVYINQVLKNLLDVIYIVYLNNIIIYSYNK